MNKIIILSSLFMLMSIWVYADDTVTASESFTIEGKVVAKATHKPVEAQLHFCEQIGDDPIQLKENCYTDKNGNFSLVLPKRPDKNAGNYALMALSVRDGICPLTGEPRKVGWNIYVTRFAAVDIPCTGNVCKIPDIEMEKVVFNDHRWPYELPAKLIEMEREDSIRYPEHSIF